MVYTVQERVEIVALFYGNNSCARLAARIFSDAHPDKPVRHKYVLELIRKFTETGSVNNRKHHPIRVVNDEATAVAVLGHVVLMENSQSIRRLSQETGVSESSVMRILHKLKFHPYKLKLVHELNEDDFDRRLEFCEICSQRLENNANLIQNICFSDESSFYLHGHVNRHNCRYWSDVNPHLTQQHHTQNPENLNVWARILGDHIVGPFFIDGNLNGQNYLEMLDNRICPEIATLIEQDPHIMENEMMFQQDGAPPHYAAPVRQFLNQHFPGHWIGRRGPVEWPARSPDLTPLDFFLWGHLKSKVYQTQPRSLDDLRHRIIEECNRITPAMLRNVRGAFEARLYLCMEVNGGHFEQYI